MSLVVDASAVVAALTGAGGVAGAVHGQLARAAALAAPHLIDPEVLNVLRRMSVVRPGLDVAVAEFRAMPLDRYSHAPLVPRIWSLRANASAYDATYLALAEALDLPLLTLDARLARVPGHRAEVMVVPA